MEMEINCIPWPTTIPMKWKETVKCLLEYIGGFSQSHNERDNPYNFFRANQQKTNGKIYSLIQGDLTNNGYYWHILAGNDETIVSLLYHVTNDSLECTSVILCLKGAMQLN